MLDRFLHQFEGNLTARKWAGIAHTSQDTAARDLNDLVALAALQVRQRHLLGTIVGKALYEGRIRLAEALLTLSAER